MKKTIKNAVVKKLNVREFNGLNNKTVELFAKILKNKHTPIEAATDIELLLLKTAEINTRTKRKQIRKQAKDDWTAKRVHERQIIENAVYVPQREPQTEESIKEDQERFAALSLVEKERLKMFFSLSLHYFQFYDENSDHGFPTRIDDWPFRVAGINTIAILAACNDAELKKLKGVGRVSVNDCHLIFKEVGLDFNSLRPVFVDLCMGFDAENTDEKPLDLSALTVGHLMLPPHIDKRVFHFLRKHFGKKYPLKAFLQKSYDHLCSLDPTFSYSVVPRLVSILDSWVPNWTSYPIAKGMADYVKDKSSRKHPFQ